MKYIVVTPKVVPLYGFRGVCMSLDGHGIYTKPSRKSRFEKVHAIGEGGGGYKNVTYYDTTACPALMVNVRGYREASACRQHSEQRKNTPRVENAWGNSSNNGKPKDTTLNTWNTALQWGGKMLYQNDHHHCYPCRLHYDDAKKIPTVVLQDRTLNSRVSSSPVAPPGRLWPEF